MPTTAGVQHMPSSRANIAASLTSEILHELILDVAIQEHRLASLRRSRTAAATQVSGPTGEANGLLNAPATNGTASPSPSKKDDSLYECLVCSRQIAAPRYASHLSGCMGLGGSRRGAGRAAAAARGTSVSRPSSNGSDTDTASKANGIKRAATASPAGGGPKPKKPKPAPLAMATISAAGQFQLPHTGSHPLSKTMSLPTSPLDCSASSTARALPPVPASAHELANSRLQAPPMQARKSLPGSSGPSTAFAQQQPTKSPASKRLPYPVAQSPANASASTGATMYQSSNAMLMSDRPDSDSEDSDAEVHQTRPPAQKTPRVPPGTAPPRNAGPALGTLTAGGVDASAGRAGGGGASGGPIGGTAQKAPRKAMPPGRKAVPTVDSGSESDDDVASAGSDSD